MADNSQSIVKKRGFPIQYIWILVALALMGIDRFTKFLITSNMELKDKIHLITCGDTEVLNLYYVLNNGAAFSKLSGHTVLLIVSTSAIILWLLYLLVFRKVSRPVYLASIGLIIGGGLGNLIDRIFNDGLVVDFIDFAIINFPIFNFADICAVCGAGLLLVSVVCDEISEFRKKRSGRDNSEKHNQNGNT